MISNSKNDTSMMFKGGTLHNFFPQPMNWHQVYGPRSPSTATKMLHNHHKKIHINQLLKILLLLLSRKNIISVCNKNSTLNLLSLS